MAVNQTVIFDLAGGENGFTHYAAQMFENLSGDSYLRFHSVKSAFPLKRFRGSHHPVNSYTSPWDVFFKTMFCLPGPLLKFARLVVRKRVSTVYFPYFNHWNLFFAIMAKAAGLKIVYTAHDGRMHLGEQNPITQFEMNCLLRLSTDVIVLSQAVHDEIRPLLRSQRVHCIPLGMMALPGIVELEHIAARPKLLLVGHISKYKGAELLCEAMAGIDEDSYESLTIAGQANYPIQLPTLKKLNFHNTWLTDAQLTSFVNDADIMIFPYLEATQSGALTLAIQGLRPIICTNVGGLSEQVGPGEAHLVRPTCDALRDALKVVILDTEKRSRMRDGLRSKKEQLDWKILAQRIEKIVGCTAAGPTEETESAAEVAL